MGKMYKSFEDLPVWQKSQSLVLEVYKHTKSFPKEETYNLISQIRRAALSVAANIAEAFGRFHYLDKINFYYSSRGSLEELKSHLIISEKLKYISGKTFTNLREDIINILEELNKLITVTRKQKYK